MKAMKWILPWMVLSLSSWAVAAKTGGQGGIESVKRNSESQIRSIVEPLIEKYCRDECRLMSVQVTVDLEIPDEVSPGFDDVDTKGAEHLAPSFATIKMLIDDKVGPNSRNNIIDLLKQFLGTLPYNVRIDAQTAHFPQPIGSAGKVAEIKERITKQFKSTIEGLFQQFCPEHCLLADYELQTELVNAEEAQYGAVGEFVEESGIALKIKSITGKILVDESLTPEEQNNVLEMAKLRTGFYKNVELLMKSMKFPRPAAFMRKKISADGEGFDGEGEEGGDRKPGSVKNKNLSTTADTKANTTTNTIANATKQDTQDTKQSTKTESTNQNQASTNTSETNQKQERFERFEKIERVENGDAVQAELQKFKVYGLVLSCIIVSLLVFLAMAIQRPRSSQGGVQRILQTLTSDPASNNAPSTYKGSGGNDSLSSSDKAQLFGKAYEIQSIQDELMSIFAQQPKVAKQVFSRILTEEGIESTAQYIKIFGESVLMDLLKDPSMQSDLNELMEYIARNPIELTDDEKLDLLKRLHGRTVAGKLSVMGSRSSSLFDFLSDMDGIQVLELIRTESLTVKSIVLTQLDSQKRAAIYAQLDPDTRMSLLTELSRIDYLPKDYIFNVANALKRKRRENPRLNTEALPGSDVLVTLLERSDPEMQKTVIKNLETNNAESARLIKGKLVSIDTLCFLRDGQMLEVVLSLRHDELLQFLKAADPRIKQTILSKSPKDLVVELEEELESLPPVSREAYQALERKLLNRMKVMSNDGIINLTETNDRMLAGAATTVAGAAIVEAGPVTNDNKDAMKKVSGW